MLIGRNIIVAIAPRMLGLSLAMKVHVYKDSFSEPNKLSRVNVTVNLWEGAISRVNDMLLIELGSISIESIGDEDGDVVAPRISRCRREKDPGIVLCDFEEGLDPGSVPNDTLLIEDEEGIFNLRILFNIVPRIDYDLVLVVIAFRISRKQKGQEFLVPFVSISLSSCGDDVKIHRRFVSHPRILICINITTADEIVVSQGC